MTCGFARAHVGAAPTNPPLQPGSPSIRPRAPVRDGTPSAQVIPGSPTESHHSQIRRDLHVDPGRDAFATVGWRGQCHRGANVEPAGQSGFAHISHVSQYDLIGDSSIGRQIQALAACVPIRAGHPAFTNRAPPFTDPARFACSCSSDLVFGPRPGSAVPPRCQLITCRSGRVRPHIPRSPV